MPELPEVETSRRGIAPYCEGKIIEYIIIRQPTLRWPIPEQMLKQLEGLRISAVSRRGKYLLLQTSKGSIMIHLGMSGSLRVLERDEPVKKHDHVDIVLKKGKVIRLNDPRRFGSVLYQASNEQHELLQKLGPEPLSDGFNLDYLYQQSRGKTQAVKTFIMDSNMVVGVGNIYACESLFMAGIHPKAVAGKISKKRYEKLLSAIKTVLSAAIEQGGTTLRDFTGSDGKPGYFRQELAVYGRAGEPCHQCGATIKNIRLGQRSTFYCGNCQK